MSGSLLEIKKKIGGVSNTRKITKAMQLVAASKMQKFQKKAITAREFVWDLLDVLDNNIEQDSQSLYTAQRDGKKVLFVLYTSDKGLCGPLNTKLINALFRSDKWKNLDSSERLLITIGKKAQAYTDANKIPVLKNFQGIPENLSNLDAIPVINEILELWQNETDISEVMFVAPHYKNSFTFYPILKTFLPFSREAIESHKDIPEEEPQEKVLKDNQFMIFSPEDPEVVLQRLFEQIVQAIFIQSFMELKASEYSSRMIAMQNATDSATNMISDLKRVFNKARQQAITQEIAELIGASMALADED